MNRVQNAKNDKEPSSSIAFRFTQPHRFILNNTDHTLLLLEDLWRRYSARLCSRAACSVRFSVRLEELHEALQILVLQSELLHERADVLDRARPRHRLPQRRRHFG